MSTNYTDNGEFCDACERYGKACGPHHVHRFTTRVWLDASAEDERTAEFDGLALHAIRLDGSWNGFAVPVVTAHEFRRFVAAWAANDRNGTWAPTNVAEVGGFLVYADNEGESLSSWRAAEPEALFVRGPAVTVYALDGWAWSA